MAVRELGEKHRGKKNRRETPGTREKGRRELNRGEGQLKGKGISIGSRSSNLKSGLAGGGEEPREKKGKNELYFGVTAPRRGLSRG